MASIDDILKRAKPRERTVPVCIRGDLAGEAERLAAELARVSEDWEPDSIADQHPGRALAAQLKKLQAEVREHEEPFTLRYIGDRAYSDLLAAHPADNDTEAFNSETFPRALIAASCVDPVMTPEQVADLFEVINEGEIKKLFDAAWDVHHSTETVPFSLAASALLAGLTGES
ncbi:hypothetical protein PV620_30275 [Streptomyces sp. ME02-6978a]|uniref:hypothetical protein n=1 Tax=unclassified Streptomyces TaxID=2593676 RepID=UPI0029AE96BE|nr:MULTISPECIES: hypothetical protein [unclassified Streptomyces]MDX3087193.1 hypothetical protein [Streptomyces sp. ME12-02E]MDX3335835.1 hypothetical protein [Streptomyces sp. ME02-6978a]